MNNKIVFAILGLVVAFGVTRCMTSNDKPVASTTPATPAPAVTAPAKPVELTPAQIAENKRVADNIKAAQAAEKADAEKRAERDKVARGQATVMIAAIAQSARDPDSVKYSSMFAADNGAMCIEYTATNAFNARVRGFAVMPPKSTKVSFDNVGQWNAHCAKTPGHELMTAAMYDAQEKALSR